MHILFNFGNLDIVIKRHLLQNLNSRHEKIHFGIELLDLNNGEFSFSLRCAGMSIFAMNSLPLGPCGARVKKITIVVPLPP